MPGRAVVQWDKEDCADLGIIKVDLLGLGMMAVIKDSIELVQQHENKTLDMAQLPRDDPETYAILRKADTVGMFQVESRAQMASLPANGPECFYDLVVQVAIIRPGPIVGKMKNPYLRRRRGLEPVTYPTDSLRPVLARTLGVPLFQEQLLRMAMTVANFTGAEADELRKAVGMRRSQKRMQELTVKIRQGMTVNNIPAATQEDIIQSISSFALYGFPESHAASFALLAYASAYLKVKHLAAFTCAILNNQPMGFYMPAVLVKDAQRHGLRVRPIDVQRSAALCTIEHEPNGALSVRVGLNYAKGLRLQVAEEIVANRVSGGRFNSSEDLALRVPQLNRKELKQLAMTGALNWIGSIEHRRDALWQVERIGRPAGPLFQLPALDAVVSTPLRQMTTEERLVADYAGTGLTTGPHPMAYRRAELQGRGVLSAVELKTAPAGCSVTIAGCVIARQRPGTALGFIFLSVEDETGIGNVIIHPDLYEQDRVLVTREKFLVIKGMLQNQDGVVHVRATCLSHLSMNGIAVNSHDFH